MPTHEDIQCPHCKGENKISFDKSPWVELICDHCKRLIGIKKSDMWRYKQMLDKRDNDHSA